MAEYTYPNYLSSLGGTFTPTVTLVGGAGNTVPVYTVNGGRYTRIGNRVLVNVQLTGDGGAEGAEGAGTGIINIALPITASASALVLNMPAGYGFNNTTHYNIFGTISASGTTIALSNFSSATVKTDMVGNDQNNINRLIYLSFAYEV